MTIDGGKFPDLRIDSGELTITEVNNEYVAGRTEFIVLSKDVNGERRKFQTQGSFRTAVRR